MAKEQIKSAFPKWEEWQVEATHKYGHETIQGEMGKHTSDDYEYEKVGDEPLRMKSLPQIIVDNDNAHSHNSGKRWFVAGDSEVKVKEAKSLPDMKVKEAQPTQPKKEAKAKTDEALVEA